MADRGGRAAAAKAAYNRVRERVVRWYDADEVIE
jgi:hypothetical protein